MDDSTKMDEVPLFNEQEADLLAELLLGPIDVVESDRRQDRLFAPVVPPAPIAVGALPQRSGPSLFGPETGATASPVPVPPVEPGRLFGDHDNARMATPEHEARSVDFVPVERAEPEDDDRRRRLVVVFLILALMAVALVLALTNGGADRTEVDSNADPDAVTTVLTQNDLGDATEQPATTDQRATTEPPVTAEPSITTEQPAATELPATTAPAVTSRPQTTNRPTTTRPPTTTGPTTTGSTTTGPTSPPTTPGVTFPKPTWTAPPEPPQTTAPSQTVAPTTAGSVTTAASATTAGSVTTAASATTAAR